ASLARDRPVEHFELLRRATLDDALHDVGHLVSRHRIDDLRAIVDELRLLLAGPFSCRAIGALAIIVLPDGAAVTILDTIDQRRLYLLAAIRDDAVGADHAQQRGFAGAECHGQDRHQIVVDAETPRIFDNDRHTHVVRQADGHQVARMLDAEAQGRGAGRGSGLVVLRAPLRHASALTDTERTVDHAARPRLATSSPPP